MQRLPFFVLKLLSHITYDCSLRSLEYSNLFDMSHAKSKMIMRNLQINNNEKLCACEIEDSYCVLPHKINYIPLRIQEQVYQTHVAGFLRIFTVAFEKTKKHGPWV